MGKSRQDIPVSDSDLVKLISMLAVREEHNQLSPAAESTREGMDVEVSMTALALELARARGLDADAIWEQGRHVR